MQFFRHSRHSDIFLYIFFVRFVFSFFPLSNGNDSSGMGNPGIGTHQNRRIVFFAQFIRVFHKVFAFLRVCRLQHRNARAFSMVTGILLILAGVASVIVGYQDNQTAGNACVSSRVKRIRRHIQSYMLHTGKGSGSSDTRADRDFCAYLFVGRPFHMDFIIPGRRFRHFCTWSSRVGGNHLYSCFISASREGFIS